MSKQIIIGMREYNFKDETNGWDVAGMSIYYKETLESREGLSAKGFTAGRFSVKAGTDLYKRMLAANYEKPFEAEVIFDILPNSKKPVLTNIIF